MTEDTMTEDRKPTLIVGGTGETGRRVAAKLAARGMVTRVASRSGETRFDWNDRKTWRSVLDGVSAVYLTYSPDLAVPEAPPAIEGKYKGSTRDTKYKGQCSFQEVQGTEVQGTVFFPEPRGDGGNLQF